MAAANNGLMMKTIKWSAALFSAMKPLVQPHLLWDSNFGVIIEETVSEDESVRPYKAKTKESHRLAAIASGSKEDDQLDSLDAEKPHEKVAKNLSGKGSQI